MNRILAATVIALLFTFFPQSQSAQQAQKSPDAQAKSPGDTPTVDQIISKYVQAIGGAASSRKLTSRVVKGTFAITAAQNLSGSFEAYGKAPNKSLVLLNFPDTGVVREGYDGVIGWSQEPEEEVRVMTGAELASTKVDSDFYKDTRLKEVFPKLIFKGIEKVGDILTHKLEGVSKDGYSETMYFAVESGLLVRTDSIEESPSGKTVVEIHHEDYREVDGIKMPFTVHHRSTELSITFRINEVKHNVPIEDDKFEKPKS
jgi:zinc protease